MDADWTESSDLAYLYVFMSDCQATDHLAIDCCALRHAYHLQCALTEYIVGQYACSRVAIHLIVKFITKQVISRRMLARESSLVPRRAALDDSQQHLSK